MSLSYTYNYIFYTSLISLLLLYYYDNYYYYIISSLSPDYQHIIYLYPLIIHSSYTSNVPYPLHYLYLLTINLLLLLCTFLYA